jgi:GNAT superfamily N-acetyltransferase
LRSEHRKSISSQHSRNQKRTIGQIAGLELQSSFIFKSQSAFKGSAATDKDWRRRGIASALLEAAAKVAQKYNVSRVALVAKGALVPFYEKRRFLSVRNLPSFLGSIDGVKEYPDSHTFIEALWLA